jgi:hypothetical protein
MRRLFVILVGAIAALAVSVPLAVGGQANPHFIGTPTCAKDSKTFVLTCSGKAAGLGDLPTAAFLTADSVTEQLQCVNHGGNVAPGIKATSPSQAGPTQQIAPHDGQITFSVSLSPPPTPSPTAAGCPNGNWKVVVLSVTYDDVVLHIQQNGVDVLSFDFGTIDP